MCIKKGFLSDLYALIFLTEKWVYNINVTPNTFGFKTRKFHIG